MLVCKGRTLVPLERSPKMANFGHIPRDSGPVSTTVTLTRGDGGPLKPELESINDPQLSAELREIEPGEKYELEITASPPWPNDRLRGRVTLSTGLSKAPRETIDVRGEVAPRLKAQPARFTLPANVTTEMEQRVKLVWAGEPGKVLKVTSTDPRLTVWVEEEGVDQMVVLRAPAGYKPTSRTMASVTVTTDDTSAPTLRISVSAPAGGDRARPRVRPSSSKGSPGVRKALDATSQPSH